MVSTVYYTDELVTLYLANCLEELAWADADMLITNPPYGLGGALSKRGHGLNRSVHAVQTWDDNVEARDAVMALWGNRPYAVFGSPKRLDTALPHRSAPLVWDKAATTLGSSSWPWWPCYELIYVNGAGWHGRKTYGILRVPHHSKKALQEGHPTPKPVKLMEVLVRAAPPGLIADPFCGSGATLRAAKNVGRRAVGIEIDERYCKRTARRLTQEVLFHDNADPVPSAHGVTEDTGSF